MFVWFLHEKGYNFFNVNRLTVAEWNMLIEAYNYVGVKQELMSKSKK